MTVTTTSTSTTPKKTLWLDVDPGHDDAMAILLAGHHGRGDGLHILGISTTSGNQSVEKTTVNALRVLTVCGLADEVPVVQGSSKPLLGGHKVCEEIHGESGLDGTQFPPVTASPVDENAIVHMYRKISENPTPVHLVATAQLTNVALLLSVFPDVKRNIEQIVIMGGAIGIGNMNPAGEFNIENDPEAARIVFESGMRVVMVPLEVTHTALVTPDVISHLRGIGTPFTQLLMELMLFFAESYEKTFKIPHPPLHDPCAVAYIIDPSMFECDLMNVEVETGGYCRGRTVCDVYHMTDRPKNVHVCTKMDVPKFFTLLYSAIDSANKISCLNSNINNSDSNNNSNTL